MNKLLVICGPTATGKTSLAVKLAKKFNGELVSADSRQVYKGMDIGTGKDHPKDTIVHLLDVVEPDEEFNVAKYYQLAWPVIRDIWKKGGLPIVVGGTGFYIKAIVDGIESLGIEPDWELREKLRNQKTEELKNMLKKLDPERWQKMNESDRQNSRRLIRAIEIATAKSSKSTTKNAIAENVAKFNLLMVGLSAPNKTLYQRIDERIKERLRQRVEDEIRRLLDKGYTWESSVLGETLGYREWQPFFKGKATKEEVIKRWKFDEHAYARRQMTWFKKDLRIHWIDIIKRNWKEEVELLVKRWYNPNQSEYSDTYG